MIDLYTMFAKMQAAGSLPYQQISGGNRNAGKSEGSGNDAFEKVFQQAAGRGRTKQAEPGHKSEETVPPADKIEPDEDMAAIAGASIIQENKQIETPPEQGGQQEAVSILEGNKDIGTQAPASPQPEITDGTLASAVQQLEETGEELTARMPQQAPGQIQEAKGTENPESTPVESTVSEETGSPCPLENKNDSAQTGQSMKQDGGSKEDSSESDASRLFATQQQVDIAPERIAGAERLNAAANTPQATATPQTLFDTMVQNIATSQSNGTSYMEIQLKPEFLGKVAIQMALSDNGLEIKIKSDDMNIKGLIAGQIAQLSESLSDKGVKVTSIDVVYSEVSEHAFGESASKGGQQQPERQVYGRAEQPLNLAFGLGFTEDAGELSMLDAGMSSVEYRA